MTERRLSLCAVLPLCLLAVIAVLPRQGAARRAPAGRTANAAPPRPHPAQLAAAYGRLPVSFEPNQGQTDRQARFLARGRRYTLFLTRTGTVLSLSPQRRRERRELVRNGETGTQRAVTGDQLPPFRGGQRLALLDESSLSPARLTASHIPAPSLHPDSSAFSANSAVSQPVALRMQMVGSNPSPVLDGLDPRPGKSNYFIGNDPKRWRTNVPNYAKVRCRQVYPGIDLVYYGNQQQLEYDFVVAPGARPGAIRLAFEGAQRVEIDRAGDLVLHTPSGEVRHHRPVVYQEVNGARRAIAGRFVILPSTDKPRTTNNQRRTTNDQRRTPKTQHPTPNTQDPTPNTQHRPTPVLVAFQVAAYDHRQPLVIDPALGLAYSTYLGGSGADEGLAIAVDSGGNAYVTGQTTSDNFPTKNPGHPNLSGPSDAFITKLNPAGSALVYSTYFGGSGEEFGRGIAVNNDFAYVTGRTSSLDFPLAGAVQPVFGGGTFDAFAIRVDTSGSSLVWSTYLGGSGEENIFNDQGAIAVDPAGNAYVTGGTCSDDFPTANALQPAFAGGVDDAFVTEITADGSAYVFSTYLGGSGRDAGSAIAVDALGHAYVGGNTDSRDFPTVNPFQAVLGGQQDAFVVKLHANGAFIEYSTYMGGDNFDAAHGIAIDSSGKIYLVGETSSDNFPVKNAFQAALAGSSDAFAARIDPANVGAASLLYSTFLGGTGLDEGLGAAADPDDNLWLAGFTLSPDLPTVNAFQGALKGGEDGFIAKIEPSPLGMATLAFSSFLGGTGDDFCNAIAVDSARNAYVTGETSSADFPTVNPFQANLGGGTDAFVSKVAPVGPPPPNPPTQLAAVVVSSAQINVSWRDNSDDELYFELERRTGGDEGVGAAQVLIRRVPASQGRGRTVRFTDTQSLAPNTIYNYRVRAVNNAGASPFVGPVQVKTPAQLVINSAVLRLFRGAKQVAQILLHRRRDGSFDGTFPNLSPGVYRAMAEGFSSNNGTGRVVARAEGTATVSARKTVNLVLTWRAVP